MSERERFEAWVLFNLKIYGVAKLDNDEYVSCATQAAWEAWQAACPDGWQCVPKEPTDGMCDSVMWATHDNTARCIWVDMLSAAPKPGEL